MRHGLLGLFAAASACLLLGSFLILKPTSVSTRLAKEDDMFQTELSLAMDHRGGDSVIMPKMQNDTAKALLGQSSWRLLHTMGQRYPESPTDDERQAFKSFLYLFSRLYPCGECAAHFQTMLKEYPPQTANRNTASLYLCMLHNKVNIRLEKEEFDCSKLEGLYDCGCGDEEKKDLPRLAVGTKEEGEGSDLIDPVTGEELIKG